MDGNDLLSYWPALGECEAGPCALQTWGSERRLGLDTSKDAANNNQPDLALTSGDETSLGRAQCQRKGTSTDHQSTLQEACVLTQVSRLPDPKLRVAALIWEVSASLPCPHPDPRSALLVHWPAAQGPQE